MRLSKKGKIGALVGTLSEVRKCVFTGTLSVKMFENVCWVGLCSYICGFAFRKCESPAIHAFLCRRGEKNMSENAILDTSAQAENALKDKANTAKEDAKASKEKAAAKTSAPSSKKKKEPMSVSRRTLVIGAGSTIALLGFGALRYVGHNPLVHPPGGQNEAHLVSACIRCEKCYEACPRKVIVPAHIEDGLLGMRSPMLNFDDNYCDFCAEENGGDPLCVRACPTQALVLETGASAKNIILGLAVIDEKQCLAYRDTGCRYCFDACAEAGYDAIELTSGGANPHPVVLNEKCVGFGACESVCVSLKAGSIVAGVTERAIVVKPLS